MIMSRNGEEMRGGSELGEISVESFDDCCSSCASKHPKTTMGEYRVSKKKCKCYKTYYGKLKIPQNSKSETMSK